jgi:hypothetical protein
MSKVKELLSTAIEEELHGEEWRLRLALLKESTEYRAFWDEYAEKALQAHKHIYDFYARHDCTEGMSEEVANAFFVECKEALQALNSFNGPLREKFGIELVLFRWAEWFDALNPYKQNDKAFVRLFWLPPIAQVKGETPSEHRYYDANSKLKPSERLLKVDLSRKRGELLREFTLFLDLVEAHRANGDVPESWARNYAVWEPDTSRFRSETWKALEIWRLWWRKGKTYREIARTLKISIQAAKMALRRVHELIEGEPYDPEAAMRKSLKISELEKKCFNCPDKHKCTELCSDVLAYVEQDHASQREPDTGTTDPFIINPKGFNFKKFEDRFIDAIDKTLPKK